MQGNSEKLSIGGLNSEMHSRCEIWPINDPYLINGSQLENIGADHIKIAMAIDEVNQDHQSSTQIDGPCCIAGLLSKNTKSTYIGLGHERYAIAINHIAISESEKTMEWAYTYIGIRAMRLT